MKNRKKIVAALLAGTMMMGMNTIAFADTADMAVKTVATGTQETEASLTVTKNLELAEGITLPDVTFSFEISPVADAPEATIDPVAYSTEDNPGALENGKYVISKHAAVRFIGEFPKPGVYEYTVSEKAGSAEGVIYATDTYTLRVYVANKTDGGFYIKTITAVKDDEKQEEIVFTNTYVKDASLVIKKETVGDYADKKQDFEFTIEFIKSATEKDTVTSYTGKIGTETVECKIGEETHFYLHDGEQLVFDPIPAGTRYIVTEVGKADDYTPEISVVENGTQTATSVKGTDADDLSSATATDQTNNLIGENDNKVTFVNSYKDIPVTGVSLENLPFILMAMIAAAAMFAVTVLNRMRR